MANIATGRYSSRQMETGLSVPEHDYIGITNDGNGNPTTVVYRAGGASGQIVSTVNMTYDGNGFLTSVTRVS
jgi:YD repeat-containing protein